MRLEHFELLLGHRRSDSQLRALLLKPLHCFLEMVDLITTDEIENIRTREKIITYLGTQISHCARSSIINFVARSYTSTIDSHLSVFVKKAVSLLAQRIIISHVNAFKRRLFQLLDLIQDLFLQGGILFRVLKFLFKSIVHNFLRLDLLILRSHFIFNFASSFFLNVPQLQLLLLK